MITQLYGFTDYFLDRSSFETDDNASYPVWHFTPSEKDAGRITVDWNAVNQGNGNMITRTKTIRYKKINGVVSFSGLTTGYSQGDTGQNNVDFTFSTNGNEIILSVAGLAGQIYRHTMKIERLTSEAL